jgi:Zn-dependent M28 family amino/carboxypeptidase
MPRVLLALLLAGCGDKEVVLPPTDQGKLLATLETLSAMGEKQPGTPAGIAAAEYLAERFRQIGLADVGFETFSFPRWELMSKQLAVTIDGVPLTPGFDVFEAAGSGTVDAEIVNVETANDTDLAGKDITGKIALVVRDPSFHRSAQLRNVTAKGAAGMLYLSIAPDNLRQIGSVRFDWETAGTIPAITVGKDDGATIKNAVLAGKTVRAQLSVVTRSTPGTGRNVVGKLAGERPEMIVIGAHFDTWGSGSSDNGSGVAELLALAERRVARGKPRYTLMFIGFDGEEIGLYGGYDFLRKHHVIAEEPILAVLNLESPSAHNPEIAGLVHSNQPELDLALQRAQLRDIYSYYVALEVVAQIFGGIIPTDIQGVYRHGVPTVSTAVTNAYYHTVMDTPDKVDLVLLARSTDAFDEAITNLCKLEPAAFAVPDPEVWTAEVQVGGATTFAVDAVIKDGAGAVRANIPTTIAVLVDDFTLAGSASGMTDASGRVSLVLPVDVRTMGNGNRFLHLGAGPSYPLVEKIVALP